MDDLLEQLALDPWGHLVLHYLATSGMWNCYLFLLIASRLIGVLVLAPCLITNPIPLRARLALIVLLSLIIVPALSTPSLTGTEITQTTQEAFTSQALPTTVLDLICVVLTEVGLGGVFGTGIIAVFAGLRLAGEWLDRHSGLGMATVLNPEWIGGGSACGSLTLWLGIVTFLLIEPLGGHFAIVQSMLHSFQAVPIGSAADASGGLPLLNGLIQESLILGLRISMPLIATMTLIDVTFAFANRGAPAAASSFCQSIRLGVGLFVLAMTMTTIPDAVAITVESVLQWFGASLPTR